MMKTSIFAVTAFALTAFGGCKKKTEDVTTAPKTTEGSAATMTGSSEAPKPDQMKAGSDTAKAPEPAKPMTGAEIAEMYKKCSGYVNDAKFDDFKKDCVDATTFVSHSIGVGEDKKLDGLISFLTDMKTAFPDMKHTPQAILVSGRNIFAVNLITGTHEGTLKTPMGDVPATHKKVGVMMFHRLALNDANKVTEEWGISDTMTMMGQLGLAPKGMQPTRAAIEKGVDAPMVAVAADDDKEKKNLEAFKKGNDAFSAHKLADMMALMTDDAVESDQAGDKDHKGKADIEKGAKAFQAAFSDAKLDGVQMWAAGDYVVGIGKFEGTNDHDMGPMKKTGKHVSLDYVEVAQMKDGKIAQLWRFHSNMQFAQQMGLMPEMGAKGADAKDAPKDAKDATKGAKDAPKDMKAPPKADKK